MDMEMEICSGERIIVILSSRLYCLEEGDSIMFHNNTITLNIETRKVLIFKNKIEGIEIYGKTFKDLEINERILVDNLS